MMETEIRTYTYDNGEFQRIQIVRAEKWSDLQFRLQDSTFYYNIRDSLCTQVSREYKHRFLWWRWGTKGYHVTLINFNPHSKVLYNTFIQVE